MQNPEKSVLLHCCCAPCTIMPLEALQNEYQNVALYYSNSNIHPKEEYRLRLKTLEDFAQAQGVTLIVDEYAPERWEEAVGVFGGPYPIIEDSEESEHMEALRKKRCHACYELRMAPLARLAQDNGYECLSTTLTISPYQFTEIILSTMREQAKSCSVEPLERDWRKLYSEATKKSRQFNMYRQNYCGCRFSLIEAKMEREARKALRDKARKEKHEH